MGRDKKGKKGRGEEAGEEVVTKETSVSHDTAKTKGKNQKNGDCDDDVISLKSKTDDDAEDERVQKKSKQSKKQKDIKIADDEDEKPNKATGKGNEGKDAKKKKKSKKDKYADSEDDDVTGDVSSEQTKKPKSDSEEESITSGNQSDKKRSKTKPGKSKPSGFALLDVEGDEPSQISDTENLGLEKDEGEKEDVKPAAKGGKKSKKKERRKKDEDDEDISKVLEELALEMRGEAPVENKSTKEAEDEAEPPVKEKTKKKKEKKKDTESTEKPAEPESVAVADDDDDDDESHTVKTAAQKKKEKKEKEKAKRKKVADQEKGQTLKKVTADVKSTAVEDDKVPEPIDDDDKDDDDDTKDSKKKKKKKKGEEDKEKKRPGKKQIAAMQEALKKVKEEEERLQLEQEAKIKAEEEAELLRLEKLRLEQERKDKKKQKEKEKRERLKAEGKLLSKTQRQNRARMEATLAALRQQGVEVPQIGERKERPQRSGDWKRLPKKKDITQDETKEEAMEISINEKESTPEAKSDDATMRVEPEATVEEEDDDVKDAWDETSEEDSEEESSKKVTTKHAKKHSSAESSEESDSDNSEESESDDSEEESSESEADTRNNEEKIRERAIERIMKRREENESKRSLSKLRSPVVCVLGHVDTGKTKLLDKIRRTHVQDSEAGGITQQIGATMVPQDALKDQCKMVKNFAELELKVPGLLIIDTPGHESFSNLRSRGSSLCDIAILVVDIMHGLEPQTIESINLLKQKKTPFIVALNKIDRLYEWKPLKNKDIQDVIKGQARNTKMEFEDRMKDVILQFANQGLNAVVSYANTDPRSYISMVPTSAMTGDGMGNLMSLVVELTQTMMAKRLAFTEELQATVLEVKAIPGLGTTVDAILVNGRLREGDTLVLAGYEGPIVTQIRAVLMPQPLKELRVKTPYEEFKEVEAAQGVKITAKDLDKTIAGLQLLVANHPDEIPILKDEVSSSFKEAMSSIKLAERGVYVQASTLGSLEALLEFLRASTIPYAGIRIGPIVKKDVMKASIMLEHDSQYAVILAFDVKVERDAQELADSLGVKLFQADIIYHLFDKFTAYREELKNKKREEFKNVAVFPCKLRILPQYIFNSRDPIVVGVIVEAGIVKEGTPICIPTREFLDIGIVTTIEINHKTIDSARKGQEVCIKIEPTGADAPKMYGRHFEHTDMLVSKITRQSIDVCKEYFRDDLLKTDWQLMVELKKTFQIM